jgi:hypothetical protein
MVRAFQCTLRFKLLTLWFDYADNAQDTVVVDIFEHWLEPVEHA